MASPFWKSNICVPTWTDFVKGWINSYSTRLIDSTPPPRILPPLYNGILIRKAMAEDIEQLPEFWSRWYSTTKAARCIVPLSHILKINSSGSGEIFVCVKDGIVIGSIVRRWLKGLHMREVVWPRAGIIDYFCIHPAHRKKGIGRSLLTFLHNSTLFTEGAMLPQLMLWEGIQPTIPAASIGLFLYKKCVEPIDVTNNRAIELPWSDTLWKSLQRRNDIWNESGGERTEETSLWAIGPHRLAIWNTFHRSVPEGLLIGIVVGGEYTAATAATISHGHPYGILLLPGHLAVDGWTIDSPYQWISYNTQMNFMSYKFPGIFL